MEKLNELHDNLTEQIEKMNAPLIKEPILEELKREVNEYFELKKEYKQRHVDQYTIGLLSKRIVELNKQVEQLKRQIK